MKESLPEHADKKVNLERRKFELSTAKELLSKIVNEDEFEPLEQEEEPTPLESIISYVCDIFSKKSGDTPTTGIGNTEFPKPKCIESICGP